MKKKSLSRETPGQSIDEQSISEETPVQCVTGDIDHSSDDETDYEDYEDDDSIDASKGANKKGNKRLEMAKLIRQVYILLRRQLRFIFTTGTKLSTETYILPCFLCLNCQNLTKVL